MITLQLKVSQRVCLFKLTTIPLLHAAIAKCNALDLTWHTIRQGADLLTGSLPSGHGAEFFEVATAAQPWGPRVYPTSRHLGSGFIVLLESWALFVKCSSQARPCLLQCTVTYSGKPVSSQSASVPFVACHG